MPSEQTRNKIVDLLRDRKMRTVHEIADELNIKLSSVTSNMTILKMESKVTMIGYQYTVSNVSLVNEWLRRDWK